MFKAIWPRKSTDEIKSLVVTAVASLERARVEEQSAALGGAAGGKSGQTKPTGTQRVANLLQRMTASQAVKQQREGVQRDVQV
jgi:hypothetical protein